MDCLPRFIVIKSLDTKQNAYYRNETEDVRGYVSCGEENAFSPLAKIEVEVSYVDIKYVHLRFSHTNKYWGKSPTDKWIVASSAQPEEDQSDPSCTLFEPIFENEGQNLIYFTHVQSGGKVRVEVDDDAYKSRIYVDHDDDKLGSYSKFTFVDWESLVKLPKYVAFKGDNDKYLKVKSLEVDFSGDDLNDEDVTYEVLSQPDGQIRIKSVHFDKFWRRTPNSICCDSSDARKDDVDTLFWPVKLDGHTIALRSAGNNEFCNRLTVEEGKRDSLIVGINYITKEAKFVVEELVVERSIYNVRYRMEDARVYDERTFVAARGGASNNNETESSNLAINFSTVDISSYSFTNSLSVIAGVETTIEAGIPLIVGGGKVEVSPDSISTKKLVWGEITETKKAIEITHTVMLPPKSRVNVNFAATGGKCSVPFSYNQRDRMMDGTIVTSEHSDGIFEGANNYDFHIEELPILAKSSKKDVHSIE